MAKEAQFITISENEDGGWGWGDDPSFDTYEEALEACREEHPDASIVAALPDGPPDRKGEGGTLV